MIAFGVTIVVPLAAGLVYFLMAAEINRVSKVRKIMFGEIGYRKIGLAFLLMGVYFITRPLQNSLGPHPWPLIVNCARQFFLMAIIAPAILVGIFHWVPSEDHTPRSAAFAAYIVGFFMALIYILINTVAVDGSKVVATFGGYAFYDPTWFSVGTPRPQLVLVHLISQLVSPVGYFLLAAAYVRHRRHEYELTHVYNLMPLKWRHLEMSLAIFACSLIIAGVAAVFGQYYTYLWLIYFIGAIIAGFIELRGIKIPPRGAPADLQQAAAV